MKLLILILSSKTYPSSRNKKAIKKTWIRNNPKNSTVLFYESGQIQTKIEDTLYVEVDSTTKNLGYKFLLGIEWCLKNIDFDYIFHTNTSSYVNIPVLEEFITNNYSDEEFLYSGIPMVRDYKNSNDFINFMSGAGIIMNKKTLELILSKKDNWDHNEWNDVALGKLLDRNNVQFSIGKRQDIKNNFYDNTLDFNNYHYRLRIDNHYGYPRFLEYYLFLEIYKAIKQLNPNLNNKYKRNVFEIFKFFRVESPKLKFILFIKKIVKIIFPNSIYSKIKLIVPKFVYRYLNQRF